MSEIPRSSRIAVFGFYITGLALIAAVVVGLSVIVRARKTAAETERSHRVSALAAGPRVAVAVVHMSDPNRSLSLLGEARPFYSTTLYARLSGYLREIRVDRGDRVRANDILAVIESPETEQQYRAALADLQNRRVLATRARALVTPGVVSRQDLDTAEANERIADANADTIAATRGYRYLRAPFDGVVTARYADPGALVQNAAATQSGALPVVRVSDIDHLRIFVYLDQRDATVVHVSDPVEITLPDRPEIHIPASVTRLAGELDARTRTLLTEVDVDNRDGVIPAGSFVQVHLRVREPSYPEIPSEAIVMRGTQPSVVLVDGGDHVTYVPITIVDDDGQRTRVLRGAAAGQRVAINVGESLADGQRVQPVIVPTRGAAGGGTQQSAHAAAPGNAGGATQADASTRDAAR